MESKSIFFVIGSPGAGKTTFCRGMKKYCNSIGKKFFYCNLDPGIHWKSKKNLDICHLVSSHEIITELHLGPNGALIFTIEYFERNLDWFESKIEFLNSFSNPFFLFCDFPGQIELFSHHWSLKNLIKRIKKKKINVKCVFLTDFFLLQDTSINPSIFLNCLLIIFNLEASCLHLLTKTDLFQLSNPRKNSWSYPEITKSHIYTKRTNKKFFWSVRILRKFKEMIFDFSPLKTYPVSVKDSFLFKRIFEKLEGF